MAEPVNRTVPATGPRVPDLQTQIDDLSLALQDWRRTREYSQPAEERLVQITLQCARMVESWQQMERSRPAGAAGPEGGPAAADRLHAATGERLRALERHIEHEWEALPEGRNQLGRRLSQQASGSTETTGGPSDLTPRGLVSVESRLAALEQDLHAGIAQLSRDLQAVLAELRSARPRSQPGAPPAFPLESVARIHQELRESDAEGAGAGTLAPGPNRALPQAAESATALAARVESLERAVATATDAAAQPRGGWRPLYSVIALLVALAGMAAFGIWMQRRVDARLNDAALRISEAERQRDDTTAAIREEAARQVADARESAAQAQIVGNVLAAPDLVRYWLTGTTDDSRTYAQVLISRSRGLVFSASRLESAGSGRTYQLWLLTRGGPVSAGLITPDSAGRVTLATDIPPTLPGRLMGALVTIEASGGGSEPSAERVLIRAE